MDRKQTELRIAELRRLIAKADHDYYDLHRPTVGDADYDLWEKELLALESANPEFANSASPVQKHTSKNMHNRPACVCSPDPRIACGTGRILTRTPSRAPLAPWGQNSAGHARSLSCDSRTPA